jgi:hypothetical protein
MRIILSVSTLYLLQEKCRGRKEEEEEEVREHNTT